MLTENTLKFERKCKNPKCGHLQSFANNVGEWNCPKCHILNDVRGKKE